ncbi:carboxylase [Mycolicibacterium agri]|uniref:Carboxylase n=1 Tax=Mycolicibacterium agri TaxID=36811 RepID=A0A2A7NDZ6_MYCAG|nr:pyruvate carboxylase subunit B [Mycolicibacterium agri]PEG41937.1 carboxylase [Mycolicibacterium agri]GFG49932.1 carboxylase [Mycolicibacterium agri]
MSAKRMRYVDVTTRDGHQSLWATRMTNAMILPIAEQMDRIGFDWINLEGGAVFDVCVRFLHEDPWERMRLVAERVTATPIDIMTRGQSLFTFRFFADDVVELTIRRIRANGMRRITVYDALNDTRNLELSVRVGKEEGLHVAAALVYTLSPVHTDEYYQRIARELVALGADTVMIKDPSGLLLPDRVRTLVPALKAVIGDVPLELHSHSLSGMAEPCYLEAAQLGVDILHTASDPLAGGASLPSTEYCARHLAKEGIESRLDRDGLATMTDYFTGVAHRYGFPLAVPNRFDPDLYRHQVPGGMISNLRVDLKRMNLEDRAEEILAEAEQVRIDLGYPILVSPFAQFVIAQAMLNVLGDERYGTIPDEVAKYVRGHYGRLAGEVDPNVADRVFATGPSEPFGGRAGELIPPALPELRRERGPFDSDDDLLLAAFYSDQELTGLREARRRGAPVYPSATDPLAQLIEGLRSGPAGQSISLERPGLRLSVVR